MRYGAISTLVSAAALVAADPVKIGGANDSTFAQGRVTYEQRSMDEGRRISWRVDFVYNARGQRRVTEYRDSREPHGGDRTTFVSHDHEGYSVMARANGRTDVRFTQSMDWPIVNDHRFAIVDSASYPLAAGFAHDAKEPGLWRFGDRELNTREGSHLKFDYGQDGIRRMTRVLGPGVGTEHRYEGVVNAGGSVRVPKTCTVTSLRGGPESQTTFEIERADFSNPVSDAEVEADWYQPNARISDARVDPPVGWTYEQLVKATGKRKGLTPAELLVLSQERAPVYRRDLERKRAELARRNAGQFTSLIVVGGVFALVFAISAAIMFLVNSRRRSGG